MKKHREQTFHKAWPMAAAWKANGRRTRMCAASENLYTFVRHVHGMNYIT